MVLQDIVHDRISPVVPWNKREIVKNSSTPNQEQFNSIIVKNLLYSV
jgi:hypothetical protein